ncbi:metallophosphoesterase [Paeniroseomonas aquatica]|uniref:Metallophosphoesterase n=1 Tax=Paeniroseomonas aquatica TaxID=373043 RepID=A0ABT8A235_9PROT|nr:metallophosphoesterase [Paeniroseomonas aquatica]MDN3563813.1 metallophosphoesterase [Paeniroseomonas aquatica]
MDGDVAAGIGPASLGDAAVPREPPAARPGSRRRLLGWLGGAGAGLGGYAFGAEPGLRLRLVRHRLAPAAWPRGLALRIAIIADPHAGGPHTGLRRLARAVAMANAARPDLAVLLGDYLADHRFVTSRPSFQEVAGVLAGLRAPLGVHAVLGNHDWWEDRAAQAGERALPEAAEAFAAAGLPILHNAARPLLHHGHPVWLAGLGSQWAYRRGRQLRGADDLPGTLAAVPAGAPVLLLAHEPDIFPAVPERVAVTLSGHTHGGQVRLFGYSPLVPSRFGNRYAYGAVEEGGRHLVVSGGIGNSMLPVRLGMPPEVTLLELG